MIAPTTTIGGAASRHVEFDAAYAEHYRRLLSLARAATGSWEAAEDLTHDTFVRAWRNWHKVAAYDNPGAWLRRVLLNRVATRWRGLGRERSALARVPSTEFSADAADSAVDDSFWVAVRLLPAQQLRVALLFYAADQSVEQIATTLGCSEGTVKTHLSRARHNLAARLTNEETK